MEVSQAIELIGLREMSRRAGVSKPTVEKARNTNGFCDTIAGRKMRSVCAAEGFEIGGVSGEQPDLPIQDPLAVQIKQAQLAKNQADAATATRKNAEAEGLLLPADEVAGRIGHAGAQLRTVIDGVRREMEAQLPEDIRDAILETYDAGFSIGLDAVTKAWEVGCSVELTDYDGRKIIVPLRSEVETVAQGGPTERVVCSATAQRANGCMCGANDRVIEPTWRYPDEAMTARPDLWHDLIGQTWAAAVAPRLPLDEWAAKYRIVTQGARQGRWRPTTVPMVVEPMRAASDRRVSQITVVAPAQLNEIGLLRQPYRMGGAERR